MIDYAVSTTKNQTRARSAHIRPAAVWLFIESKRRIDDFANWRIDVANTADRSIGAGIRPKLLCDIIYFVMIYNNIYWVPQADEDRIGLIYQKCDLFG